jgi:hypothetical protein
MEREEISVTPQASDAPSPPWEPALLVAEGELENHDGPRIIALGPRGLCVGGKPASDWR